MFHLIAEYLLVLTIWFVAQVALGLYNDRRISKHWEAPKQIKVLSASVEP
jgi:hypothetical protein